MSLELNFLAHPVRQYRLLMFTNTGSVSKTKHNSVKFVKVVLYDVFWICIYCDFSDFWKIILHKEVLRRS